MSIETARAMLVAAADFGEGPARAFAQRVLEEWGRPSAETVQEHRGPMSGAERSRRWREDRKRKRDADRHATATERDETATESVTERDGAVAGPLSRSPFSDLRSSSLSSSSGSLSPESQNPEGSSGYTGAGARGGEPVQVAPAAPAESGTFALVPTDAKRNAQRNETTRVTKRNARDETKVGPIPADWRPAAETVEWCRERGVDAAAATAEFVEYWLDRARNRPRDRDARKVSWERTFKTNIERLLERERAPKLRLRGPVAEPPPPASPAERREEIERVVAENMPRPSVAAGLNGGQHGR